MPKLDFDLARFAEGFDFVVREATVPDLQATTKPEAIREMVAALVKAGAIPAASQEGIVAAILSASSSARPQSAMESRSPMPSTKR